MLYFEILEFLIIVDIYIFCLEFRRLRQLNEVVGLVCALVVYLWINHRSCVNRFWEAVFCSNLILFLNALYLVIKWDFGGLLVSWGFMILDLHELYIHFVYFEVFHPFYFQILEFKFHLPFWIFCAWNLWILEINFGVICLALRKIEVGIFHSNAQI